MTGARPIGPSSAPWPARAPARMWPDRLAYLLGRARHRVRAWLLIEAGVGRLAPWLAILFGSGVITYFSLDQEPAAWAAATLFAATAAICVMLRRRAVGFPLSLGIAAIALGFCVPTIKRAVMAHPVLSAPAWNAGIAGFVEMREVRERSDRVTLRVAESSGPRLDEQLERIRVSVRKGTAPPVGSFVELKARLSAPLAPLRPGGYDLARDLYFQRIGASGFVLGAIRSSQAPHAPSLGLRYATAIDQMRATIDKRMHSILSDDKGAIASALITGTRDAISPQINDAMYVSGLGHVLSISRLSHGGGGGDDLLCNARPLRAFSGVCQSPPDQEMGRGRRLDRCGFLSSSIWGGSGDAKDRSS